MLSNCYMLFWDPFWVLLECCIAPLSWLLQLADFCRWLYLCLQPWECLLCGELFWSTLEQLAWYAWMACGVFAGIFVQDQSGECPSVEPSLTARAITHTLGHVKIHQKPVATPLMTPAKGIHLASQLPLKPTVAHTLESHSHHGHCCNASAV